MFFQKKRQERYVNKILTYLSLPDAYFSQANSIAEAISRRAVASLDAYLQSNKKKIPFYRYIDSVCLNGDSTQLFVEEASKKISISYYDPKQKFVFEFWLSRIDLNFYLYFSSSRFTFRKKLYHVPLIFFDLSKKMMKMHEVGFYRHPNQKIFLSELENKFSYKKVLNEVSLLFPEFSQFPALVQEMYDKLETFDIEMQHNIRRLAEVEVPKLFSLYKENKDDILFFRALKMLEQQLHSWRHIHERVNQNKLENFVALLDRRYPS